jgi:hypothetical protein
MQFRTESGESERHWILLNFTENLKKSNEKDSEVKILRTLLKQNCVNTQIENPTQR